MHHLESLIQAIPPAVFAATGLPQPNGGSTLFNPSPLIDVQPLSASSPTSSSGTGLSGLGGYQTFPQGIPPPSLHVFPLTNPSNHFQGIAGPDTGRRSNSPTTTFNSLMGIAGTTSAMHHHHHQQYTPNQMAEETARMSLSAPYLYFDDEGYTRWQGEASGLPLLDLLLEQRSTWKSSSSDTTDSQSGASPPSGSDATTGSPAANETSLNPNPLNGRIWKRANINPQELWRFITNTIPPDLMDR
jgi:hypothetical protein